MRRVEINTPLTTTTGNFSPTGTLSYEVVKMQGSLTNMPASYQDGTATNVSFTCSHGKVSSTFGEGYINQYMVILNTDYGFYVGIKADTYFSSDSAPAGASFDMFRMKRQGKRNWCNPNTTFSSDGGEFLTYQGDPTYMSWSSVASTAYAVPYMGSNMWESSDNMYSFVPNLGGAGVYPRWMLMCSQPNNTSKSHMWGMASTINGKKVGISVGPTDFINYDAGTRISEPVGHSSMMVFVER